MSARVSQLTTIRDRSDEVVALAETMHGESEIYRAHTFRESGVRGLYERVLMEQLIGFTLIDNDTDTLIGFMVGYIEDSAFCDLRIAYEMFWYIHPNHRTYRNMRALLRAFESAAVREGAHKIALSTTSGIQPGGTAKLYKKMGYGLVGVVAMKEVNRNGT